jgi:ABC-type multidrug transport system fused ATPase/permease subunit
MTAFLSLVGQIQGPIYSLANQIPQIVGVLASAGRIIEVCELEEEQADPEKIRVFTDGNEGRACLGILADSVTVGYKAEAVVQNVSFDIKPGQMVMMAGKSGAGKTTLLRAIMGFLPSSEGELSFYSENGIRKKCDVNTRKLISYVPQGNTLMFGTIADNLRMGKSDATKEEMREVLRIADALDFVESLPEGVDTKIGEKATGISEGQAQRISIARALLKKSAVLILDEATSALDEKTEMKILDAIARSEHPTVLYVSHRRYLDKYADQVVEV